ncbi:prostaglandin E synthase isoform 1-T4 [Morphnus guianensis]
MMENKVFMSFTFYSTILILKMYVVAIITGQVRLRKKAFANPEDALRNGGLQYYREDPDVERCRRAHRNDMENIFPFLFLGAIYSLLDPSPAVARIHFFIFCMGRIVHTIAYLLQLKAPTRSVAYSVAQLPCFSMALQILLATTPYWWCQQDLEGLRTFQLPPEGEGLSARGAGKEDAVTARCLCKSFWMGITRLASMRAGKCELCFVSLPWQPMPMTI